MRFSILTLFPEYFDSPLKTSLLGRAQESGLLKVDFVNLRNHGEGKYRAVDDKPYGGGAGMVMMATVLERALGEVLGGVEHVDDLERDVQAVRAGEAHDPTLPLVVYLSPQGDRLTNAMARGWVEHEAEKHVVLLCGHYEGIDERALSALVHREVSIGDYILTGGEPAACVLLDVVSRFIPGVVGDQASVDGDTFEQGLIGELEPGGLKYPVFTRPATWRGRAVPEALTSGHHGEIAKWRRAQSLERTKTRRPDLLKGAPTRKK